MMKMSLIAIFAASALVLPAARTAQHAPLTATSVRYVVAPDGNEARYRVREQLMHHDLPNDAVGKTTAITGGISLSASGVIDTAASRRRCHRKWVDAVHFC